MTEEYEVKTKCGHTVKCEAWKSGVRINFTLYVDGQEHDYGSSIEYIGNYNESKEAELQAMMLADDIEQGRYDIERKIHH